MMNDFFGSRLLIKIVISMFFSAIVCLSADAGDSFKESASGRHRLNRLPAAEYPVFQDDINYQRLSESLSGSIAYYEKMPPAKPLSFGADTYTAGHLIRSMKRFLTFIETKPTREALNTFVVTHYLVYAFAESDKTIDVLFTGYYEPMLHGSLTRSSRFKYPVYPKPDDLKPDVPYYSRQQIQESGALNGKVTPIAWVDDPVSLFFLHIQGSGKISLESGGIINVHYQISNGHPYKSIGKYLIDKQKLQKKNISMQSIRAYLHAHPEEMQAIFNYNPRYIFFKTVDAGPTGCFDIELTPGRSIAMDRSITPPGALAFILTQKPEVNDSGTVQSWVPFSRFMLNQDTGSAIKGPGRVDIFWGTGIYAELAAGYMKHPGQLYFIVLKPELYE